VLYRRIALNTPRARFKHIALASGALLARSWRRLPAGSPGLGIAMRRGLGIAMRLGVSFAALMARSWRRLPAGSRDLGIAMRLGVSFGAVAVLAIAANLIAEHGASIIQTTKTYPVIAPAAQIERPRPALPVALPPAEPEPRPQEAPPNDADLLDAVGQFERTLVLRAQIASPENTAVLSKAAQRLEDETRAFITATAPR
jgi:hypothetical protein